MKSESAYPPLLRQTLDHALAYLEALPEAPVAATTSLEELRARLGKPLPAAPVDALVVVDQLVRDLAGGLTHSSGGRFFSWVIGGKLPASLAADWLTATWDQNAGMFAVAPAAAVVEEVSGRWLLDLLHLPSTANFALVTGCQMAHVTCLAAARNAVLAAKGWDVEQRGLIGAPPIRVLSGDQRHGTIERAVRLLGLGRDCVIDNATDENGQLRAGPLRAALARTPAAAHIVLLQAGDLNTGSFDPYDEIIPVAREFDAWVHVDGAFGLWAAARPEYRHFTKGVENADSWATDGHKWLYVPYDSGFAFVANREAHYRSMAHHAAYLDHSAVARDQVDWNPEYSRRGRGFPPTPQSPALVARGSRRWLPSAASTPTPWSPAPANCRGSKCCMCPISTRACCAFQIPRPERPKTITIAAPKPSLRASSLQARPTSPAPPGGGGAACGFRSAAARPTPRTSRAPSPRSATRSECGVPAIVPGSDDCRPSAITDWPSLVDPERSASRSA
ncbi:pyridoxal-dependent decarboxylase [Accumulibacter sp.]|uniref:pyridoxal phosphate-dependent decarboxylase family protein n=1 Tax=Accumulibacter sp. TaxID=2053492 RepID=UPI00260B3BC7|nr:pyridoxal-dependent decarboxylase [Accumulibacter sp.]